MRALRTPPPGNQTANPQLVEGRLGRVKGLTAYTECPRHVSHRLFINTVAAKHLIAHLHAIPRIEEFISAKGLVPYYLRIRVENPLFPKGFDLRIASTGYFRSLHECQYYYVQ